jgi:Ca2+-binding RTX toxin-like protein
MRLRHLTRGVLATFVAALAAAPGADAGVNYTRTDIPIAGPESIALADLDGQNGKDIAVALPNQGSIGVLLNNGDGTFGPMTAYPTGCTNVDITLADVTNLTTGGQTPDGKIDALVACSPSVTRLRGDGAGHLTNPESFNLGMAQYLGSASLDLIALIRRAGGSNSPMLLFQRVGPGGLGRRLCTAPNLDLASRDCDEDTPVGSPMAVGDLFTTEQDVPPDEIITGLGQGKAGLFSRFIAPPGTPHGGELLWSADSRDVPGDPGLSGSAGIESATIADLEPDGDPDILVGQAMNSLADRVESIHFFNKTAAGGIEATARTLPSIPGLDAVAVADVDSDGCNDVIGAGGYGRGVVHLGDGAGNYTNGVDLPFIRYQDPSYSTRVSMVVADLDGDSLPEIVVADQLSAAVMVFHSFSNHDGAACYDDPPSAGSDSAEIAQDSGPTAIDVLANDSDLDGGAPFGVASVTQPAHGTVAITGGGSGLTYKPDAGYCRPPDVYDTFTYTLDGGSTAEVLVSVPCSGVQPTAVDDAATVTEDSGSNPVDVLANDTDPDGGTKLVIGTGTPTHGTVGLTGGGSGLKYEPSANYCGTDAFTYTLNGGSTATLTITVACVDDPPGAVGDAITVDHDSPPTAIDVLANDTDIDGGPKGVASVSTPAHGTATATGTGLTYQPAAGYCGPDSFTYALNGGSSAGVAVTVTCPPPVVPTCAAPGAVSNLAGTPGNDVLVGTAASNTIDGLAGDDCIFALAGNDTVSAGPGDDAVDGGDGRDRLVGGTGDDRLSGREDNDRLNGSAGEDDLSGGAGSDVLTASSGNDRANGGSGNDNTGGGSGDDRLAGNGGNDQLTPGTGRDVVRGGSGNDRVTARDNQLDTIDCGPGRDKVSADKSDRVAANCELVQRR